MRIIAGTAKGRRLTVPDDYAIRPSADRVRENLFNILAFRIQGARFLDLFCGTGAVGIEALSRGAAHATFIDFKETALRLTRRNLLHCRLGQFAMCLCLNLPEQLPQPALPYDIVFADPPYAFDQHEELLQAVQHKQCLAPEGMVIIETAHKCTMPDRVDALTQSRRKRYGEISLTFYA